VIFGPSTGDLLDEIVAYTKRFVVLADDAYHDTLGLWILHTHVIDVLPATARLALLSPEPGSGKTRLLEILQLLVRNPVLAANASPAAVYRMISSERKPTLLLDESDTYLMPGAPSYRDDLRGVIDAGYRPGSHVIRCEPPSMRERMFETFGAVAIAGLGRLPPTILQRSIVFPMHTRRSDEPVRAFRWRIEKQVTEPLRERINVWADENVNSVADLLSGEPLSGLEGLTDRQAEIWEPLVAIGDLAGEDWAVRSRSAADQVTNSGAQHDPTLGIQLLADIRNVVNGHDRISSTDLVGALNAVEESPWGGWPLDSRGLARKLKPYGIKPSQIRVGERTMKGYRMTEFVDVWGRYLPTRETNETEETLQVI
jgi:hypothetical protein